MASHRVVEPRAIKPDANRLNGIVLHGAWGSCSILHLRRRFLDEPVEIPNRMGSATRVKEHNLPENSHPSKSGLYPLLGADFSEAFQHRSVGKRNQVRRSFGRSAESLENRSIGC
jgi:hypothetical protein